MPGQWRRPLLSNGHSPLVQLRTRARAPGYGWVQPLVGTTVLVTESRRGPRTQCGQTRGVAYIVGIFRGAYCADTYTVQQVD